MNDHLKHEILVSGQHFHIRRRPNASRGAFDSVDSACNIGFSAEENSVSLHFHVQVLMALMCSVIDLIPLSRCKVLKCNRLLEIMAESDGLM